MYYQLKHILNDIENCIKTKIPFSIFRPGDADIKILSAILKHDKNIENMKDNERLKKSGIDYKHSLKLKNWYTEAGNNADFLSSFSEYFTKDIWYRPLSEGTYNLIKKWKKIYEKISIKNENYCSPDLNTYLFMENLDNNLLNILVKNNCKVCLITCHKKLHLKMKKANLICSEILIPPEWGNLGQVYENILNDIKNSIDNTDVYLVSGSMYARMFCNEIKKSGKIAVDIGQVLDFWNGRHAQHRFQKYIIRGKNKFLYRLTEEGKKYKDFIWGND